EVVEEQQQALVLQISLQKTRYWLLSGFFDPQCLSNRGNDQVEIANGSQWDKADAVGIVIEQLSRYLEPQARFADTTGTREGQQTHLRVSQECVYCRHFLLASNSRGGLRRPVVPRVVDQQTTTVDPVIN